MLFEVMESAETALRQPADAPKKRRRHVATKLQLLTREQLDGRTNACKFLDQLVADIQTDLGGQEHLSTIERQLVEAFAGACVTMQHLNCLLVLGRKVYLGQHAQAVSAMVRVASRLGLQRRHREVLVDPLTYARQHHASEVDDEVPQL
jgi:hypothetical protein